MKIGLTINDYYKQYIQEIANLNGTTPTTICSLILENFFSFNKNNNRYPIIQRQVRIVFANKKNKTEQENINLENNQYEKELDWDTMIKDLEKDLPTEPED